MATTTNLALHQWQAGDSFLREDFNADFRKIDAGVAGRCRIEVGTYQGTAEKGVDSTHEQVISLPFTPKAVIVYRQGQYSADYSGNAQTGYSLTLGPINKAALEIISGGFRVSNVYWGSDRYTPAMNEKGDVYCYIAFG